MLKLSRRAFLAGALTTALPRLSWAQSEDIRVICSGGFTAAYNILALRFEQVTGKKIVSAYDAFAEAGDTGALKVAMFGDAAHLSDDTTV